MTKDRDDLKSLKTSLAMIKSIVILGFAKNRSIQKLKTIKKCKSIQANKHSGHKAISKKEGMRGYHFWTPIKQEGNRWVVKCYANGKDRFSGEEFGGEDIANAVVDMLKGWLWSLNIKSISKISTI